jgi:hypothetical protein
MQPTSTVLMVAFLGVAGTLGAAIFTQVWSTRREDRRWRQEQELDERRWQREREDRREQRQREDQLRMKQQRQEVYVGFLLAVAKWASATYTVVVDRSEGAGELTSDELSRLTGLVELAEASCVPLRLHGSREVADASDELCQVMLAFVKALAGRPVDGELVERMLVTFRRASGLALDRSRADLGIT